MKVYDNMNKSDLFALWKRIVNASDLGMRTGAEAVNYIRDQLEKEKTYGAEKQ